MLCSQRQPERIVELTIFGVRIELRLPGHCSLQMLFRKDILPSTQMPSTQSVTEPPGSVNRMALSSKFVTSCRSRDASPATVTGLLAWVTS